MVEYFLSDRKCALKLVLLHHIQRCQRFHKVQTFLDAIQHLDVEYTIGRTWQQQYIETIVVTRIYKKESGPRPGKRTQTRKADPDQLMDKNSFLNQSVKNSKKLNLVKTDE